MTTPPSLVTILIENSLHEAVEHDRHALVSLPSQQSWDEKHHLSINILLSMDPLKDKDYPIDPGRIAPSLMTRLTNGEGERRFLTRFVGLPVLAGGRHIILALSIRSGAPPNPWTLAMGNRGR